MPQFQNQLKRNNNLKINILQTMSAKLRPTLPSTLPTARPFAPGDTVIHRCGAVLHVAHVTPEGVTCYATANPIPPSDLTHAPEKADPSDKSDKSDQSDLPIQNSKSNIQNS